MTRFGFALRGGFGVDLVFVFCGVCAIEFLPVWVLWVCAVYLVSRLGVSLWVRAVLCGYLTMCFVGG